MSNTLRRTGRAIAGIATLSATLALCAAAGTQPPGGNDKPAPPPPEARAPGGPGGQDRPITPDAMRDRLQRRLTEARDSVKQLEAALDKLNKGASLDEVRRMLPAPGGRGERGGDGGPGDGRPDRPLTDEERQTVREILVAAFPQMLKTWEEASAKDPEAAQRKLSEIGRLRFLLDLKKRDPQMFSMRLEEIRTAREVWSTGGEIISLERQGTTADAPAMKAAKEKLRGNVIARNTARLAVARQELIDINKRVKDKEADIERLASQDDAAIEKEMDSILERARKSPPGHTDDPLGPGRPRDRNRGPTEPRHEKPPG